MLLCLFVIIFATEIEIAKIEIDIFASPIQKFVLRAANTFHIFYPCGFLDKNIGKI